MQIGRRDQPDGLHHTLRFDRRTPVIFREHEARGLLRCPSEVVTALDVHHQLRLVPFCRIERVRLGDGTKLRILAARPRVDGERMPPRRQRPGIARIGHGAPRPHARADAKQCAAGTGIFSTSGSVVSPIDLRTSRASPGERLQPDRLSNCPPVDRA